MYLSDVLPPHNSDIKLNAPDGVVLTRAVYVFACL
jgi:hypothetical protein